MSGALRARGYVIPREAISASLLRVDPTRVFERRTDNLPQRIPYIVGCPNEIWHFDGNHKMIRWGFVISGCMDGASKRLPWLEVATNNRVKTVLDCFLKAVSKMGLPQRTRSDKGGKNLLVIQEMFARHPEADCPAITGRSI